MGILTEEQADELINILEKKNVPCSKAKFGNKFVVWYVSPKTKEWTVTIRLSTCEI
jgi:hypothetical protein